MKRELEQWHTKAGLVGEIQRVVHFTPSEELVAAAGPFFQPQFYCTVNGTHWYPMRDEAKPGTQFDGRYKDFFPSAFSYEWLAAVGDVREIL
jgi:hypothetical protein